VAGFAGTVLGADIEMRRCERGLREALAEAEEAGLALDSQGEFGRGEAIDGEAGEAGGEHLQLEGCLAAGAGQGACPGVAGALQLRERGGSAWAGVRERDAPGATCLRISDREQRIRAGSARERELGRAGLKERGGGSVLLVDFQRGVGLRQVTGGEEGRGGCRLFELLQHGLELR
jgi:hypothetical protein